MKKQTNPAHARVSSTINHGLPELDLKALDNEVDRIVKKVPPKPTGRREQPQVNLKMDPTAELGDGVDFAAAGVKDLNNFKGYHNQAGNKDEDDQRYTDPENGAHFEFTDFCKRLIKMVKNRG